MNDARRWGTYCGMTCLGGSERRECTCTGPLTCELRTHPDYEHQRAIARKRMARFFASAFNQQQQRKEPTMNRIVVKTPGRPATIELRAPMTLEDRQNIVGGTITLVPSRSMPDGCELYANDDGFALELKPNIMLPGHELPIVGCIFVEGVNAEGEQRSLTDEEATQIVGVLGDVAL